jgi:cellulose synthase (UDP-forming)
VGFQLAPDRKRRLAILEASADGAALAPEVELESLAQSTLGMGGNHLRELILEARLVAGRRSGGSVRNADIAACLRRLELRTGVRLVMPEEQVVRIAAREAGHAMLGMVHAGADRVLSASLLPSARRREPAGPPPKHQRLMPGESYRRGRVISALAGAAAEHVLHGESLDGSDPELRHATALAQRLVGRWVTSETHGLSTVVAPIGEQEFGIGLDTQPADEVIRDEAARVVDESYARAVEILARHAGRLTRLAEALIEHETLDQEAIQRFGPEPNQQGSDQPRMLRLIEPGAEPPLESPAGAQPDLRHQSVGVMSLGERARHRGLAVLWAFVTVTFWVWWLQAGGGAPWLYWPQTLMLFYQATVLPTVYWSFVGKMKRPVEIEPPPGIGVALISLCVPAHESLEVIREQLEALTSVSYPHDSWLLDEGGVPEVRALAEQRGVRYFSRRGVASWNQPVPPYQVGTKAGNVNAWLDHVASLGLDYEVFVQFDIDHLPRPDYLDRTLGYFRDPEVAWVQAPSVYGNLDNWTARGLVEQDLVFHGPLQMGFYGATRTPFIIGSHTSYRTSAIREIGGFQPTRAEDHLDTVVLAAHNYRGVFVPDLIAVGAGPSTLATYLRQQFAWAYSMMQIFLHHTPHLVRRYTRRQAFQFLFCQSWYTFWSVSLALLWALPTIALLVDRPISSVKLTDFVLYFAPVLLASSLMWCETRKWFRPSGVRLSWRGLLLGIARWPVILWALINVVLGIKRPYMITPKGVTGAQPKAATLYGPGIAMTVLPLAALWVFTATAGGGGVRGYFGLALLNAAIGLTVVATSVALEVRQLAQQSGAAVALRARAGMVAIVVAMAGLLSFSTVAVWETMTRVIS